MVFTVLEMQGNAVIQRVGGVYVFKSNQFNKRRFSPVVVN